MESVSLAVSYFSPLTQSWNIVSSGTVSSAGVCTPPRTESRFLPQEGGMATLSWCVNCGIAGMIGGVLLRSGLEFNLIRRTRPQTVQILLCLLLPQGTHGEAVEQEGRKHFACCLSSRAYSNLGQRAGKLVGELCSVG